MSKSRESRPEFAVSSSSDKTTKRLSDYLLDFTEAVFDNPDTARDTLAGVNDESELAAAVASNRATRGEDASDRILRATALLLASGFYESVKVDSETQQVADAIAVQRPQSEVSPLSPGELGVISLQAFTIRAVQFAAFEAQRPDEALVSH